MNISQTNHLSPSQSPSATGGQRPNNTAVVEDTPKLLSGPEMVMELGSRVLSNSYDGLFGDFYAFKPNS